jgi:hypothetical protein
MSMLILEIPGAVMWTSNDSTRNKFALSKRAAKQRAAGLLAGEGVGPYGPAYVQFQWVGAPKGRLGDPQNMAPAEKPLLDAGIWPDDAPRWVTVLPSSIRRPTTPKDFPGRCFVVLTPKETVQ